MFSRGKLPDGGSVEGPWQTAGRGRRVPARRVEAVMAKGGEERSRRERDREREIR